MEQWGFYFNQDRCLGCLACKMACKNWNERRRGDAQINVRNLDDYQVEKPASDGQMIMDNESFYLDQDTGETNYEEFRKYYAKEDWRRVITHEYGGSSLDSTSNTFDITVDRRYMSVSCNHCDTPACLRACPVGAIFKEQTYGAVMTNFYNCISCGKCSDACPWGAPQFYDKQFAAYTPDDPRRPKMTKCTLCIDRLGEGLKPACVAACWNRALDAGPMMELISDYGSLKELPEFEEDSMPWGKTGPNIIFKAKTDRKK